MKFEEAINQTLCKINDNLTQIKFIEQARNVRDNNIYFFTVPENGGTRTFTAGTTKVDFITGTIINPNGNTEKLQQSLSQYQLEFVHSLSIDTNQDIVLRINDSPKRTISSGFSTQIPWLTYNFIEITCTTNTNIVLFACTNPQAVIGQFKSTASDLYPASRASKFNEALPVADANFFDSDITINNNGVLRIAVQISIAGIFKIKVTRGVTTITLNLFEGSNLTASCLYAFDVPTKDGDSINMAYSNTTGTIEYCEVQFLKMGV